MLDFYLSWTYVILPALCSCFSECINMKTLREENEKEPDKSLTTQLEVFQDNMDEDEDDERELQNNLQLQLEYLLFLNTHIYIHIYIFEPQVIPSLSSRKWRLM